MTCTACTEAEADPLGHREQRADCLSCDARGIAREYGDGKPSRAIEVMSLTWTDAKTFQRGRSHYFWWRGLLNEAKEKA